MTIRGARCHKLRTARSSGVDGLLVLPRASGFADCFSLCLLACFPPPAASGTRSLVALVTGRRSPFAFNTLRALFASVEQLLTMCDFFLLQTRSLSSKFARRGPRCRCMRRHRLHCLKRQCSLGRPRTVGPPLKQATVVKACCLRDRECHRAPLSPICFPEHHARFIFIGCNLSPTMLQARRTLSQKLAYTALYKSRLVEHRSWPSR